MKTFTRRRKSSQPELTNGTPEKRVEPLPDTANNQTFLWNESRDSGRVPVEASPEHEKPVSTACSPVDQAGSKRKLDAQAVFVRRKEARVETPGETLERNEKPVNEARPPDAPAAALPAPKRQLQSQLARPPDAAAPAGLLQAGSPGQSSPPVPSGRSLFSRLPGRAGPPAPSAVPCRASAPRASATTYLGRTVPDSAGGDGADPDADADADAAVEVFRTAFSGAGATRGGATAAAAAARAGQLPPAEDDPPSPRHQQQQLQQQQRSERQQQTPPPRPALQQQQPQQQQQQQQRARQQLRSGGAAPFTAGEPPPPSQPPPAAAATDLPATATAAAPVPAAVPARPAAAASGAATAGTSTAGIAGRAGRPIGRGRLPGLPPTGQQTQTPPAAALQGAGGSRAAAATAVAAAAAAVALTPAKPAPGSAAAGPGRAAATAAAAAAAAATAAAAAAAARQGGARAGFAGVGAGAPGFGAMMMAQQRGSSRGRGGGSQGDSEGVAAAAAAAAQSIVEAQESGELLRLQDDAQYALDGLASADRAMTAAAAAAAASAAAAGGGAPPGGAAAAAAGLGAAAAAGGAGTGASGAVRESAAALAGILATRRGRAALAQPTNLAMKALTSLARVAVVPRDPVAALAAAIMLLSLVQEDALPAFGASYAAAVLVKHVLLQAENDPPPLLQLQNETHIQTQPRLQDAPAPPAAPPAAAAPGAAPSAWALLQDARAAAAAAAATAAAAASGGSNPTSSSAAAAAAAAAAVTAASRAGATAGGGGGGSGAGGGGGGGGCDGTVLRLLRLVQEGALARQVGRTDLVVGPLPLVLLAMVAASEASPKRIKYTERFKDNLLKVGILPLLGRLVAARRDAVVRHLDDKRAAAVIAVGGGGVELLPPEAAAEVAAAATDSWTNADPAGPAAQSRDGGGGSGGDAAKGLSGVGADGAGAADGGRGGGGCDDGGVRPAADPYMFFGSDPHDRSQSIPPPPPSLGLAAASPPPALPPHSAPPPLPAPLPQWCLWELQLLLRVMENATFTHKRNENELLALRVRTALPLEHAAAAAAPPLPPPLPSSQPMMGSQPSQCSLDWMDLTKTQITGGEADAAAEAEAGPPFVAVLVDLVRQLLELIEDGDGDDDGGGAAAAAAAAMGVARGRGPAMPVPPAAPVQPSAGAVCRVAAAVLMNLTHEHPDGAAAVAAAGGLQAVGGLVWRCCRPQPVAQCPPEQQHHHHHPDGGGSGDCTAPQPPRLQVCRDAIVASIDSISVGLGLLINMTVHSVANRRTLRSAVLAAAPPPPPATAAAPPPSQLQASQGMPRSLAASPTPASQPELQELLLPPPSGSEGFAAAAPPPPPPPRMVPLLCAVLNAISRPAGAAAAAARKGGREGRHPPGAGSEAAKAAEAPEAAAAAAAAGGLGGEEVTEAAMNEDFQSGQTAIAQVYSAILLGNLIAGGSEADEGDEADRRGSGGGGGEAEAEAPGSCSAAAARAEARSLLLGGSLRPVIRGISRCLAFYCRTGTITDGSRDAMAGLLQRLLRLEAEENPAAAGAAAGGGNWEELGSSGDDMSE
ncbi:hypothetical protein PLESTB_000765600 [Pleodorina starrii]|uniref:Wings apart-like protein C-terminal domain-containing protein n=1 Tax=Pleodorina starrii TaxID=330485 RepID=A0A9W6BKR6_9CHLO|nr:hypothetical protein PLESTB_000765600 [Pleodorina starrii]